MNLAGGDMDKLRQITGMVEYQMQFNGTFGSPKFGPVKYTQIKLNEGGIKT